MPRTYVTCVRDMAIRPALQARFIADADAAFPANSATVFALDASQSRSVSVPDQVTETVLPLG